MADQRDACDKCVSGGVAASKSPVDLPLLLGRRYGVAHNSTGPTSVSIDLEIGKGAGARAGGSIEATEHAWLGNARRLGNPSVMQFYSGPFMHFLSGVDTKSSVKNAAHALLQCTTIIIVQAGTRSRVSC